MTVREPIVAALLVLGVGVSVLASVALLRFSDVFARLHLTAPVTSVGAPLIAAAFVVDQGLTLASGQVAVIAVLLVVTGPAVTMAVARVEQQRRGGSAKGEPE
jgi:monovalent cation/proton antiporter MnhG/PhaG subunit